MGCVFVCVRMWVCVCVCMYSMCVCRGFVVSQVLQCYSFLTCGEKNNQNSPVKFTHMVLRRFTWCVSHIFTCNTFYFSCDFFFFFFTDALLVLYMICIICFFLDMFNVSCDFLYDSFRFKCFVLFFCKYFIHTINLLSHVNVSHASSFSHLIISHLGHTMLLFSTNCM